MDNANLDLAYGIESPVPGKVPSRTITLRGWVFDKNGQLFRGMRARVGDQEFRCHRKQARFAVARLYPDYPNAEFSGYSVEIELPRGRSEVVLDVKDQDKKWHELTRVQYRAPLVQWPWNRPKVQTYAEWVNQHDTLTDDDRTAIQAHIQTFANTPLLSIILPVYNPPEKEFRLALDSVRDQLYPHWECCIADDCSPGTHVREILEEYAAQDPRFKIAYREKNGHISAASNTAIELATGDFCVLLDHDDLLPEHALYHLALETIEHPDVDIIYSDEDKVDQSGQRQDPYFKPDYMPDLLLAQNCISHLGAYRTSLLKEIGGFRVGWEGSQDWDLALRAIEKSHPSRVRHIPRVLYHWRIMAGSTAQHLDEKPYALTAGERSVQSHFERVGVDATVTTTSENTFHLDWPLPDPPPQVTIIIPTKNQGELLQTCLRQLKENTSYPNYDILVIDHQSDDPETKALLADITSHHPHARVEPFAGPFNYAQINNHAAGLAAGDILCFMNNDIEAIEGGWLHEMAMHAARPDIGAVGCKLIFKESNIQHAGIFLGYHDAAGHLFRGQPLCSTEYANRANITSNPSAVTAACMAVEKKKFLEVDGFDEKTFAVAYNDVDLCLRLAAAGYRTLYTGHACLIHYESVSRGEAEKHSAQKDRAKAEISALQERWGHLLANDPGYNPNLTLQGEDLALAFPPRLSKPWENTTT